MPREGDSLLVTDGGGRHFFGFVKRCLVYLFVRYFWCIIGIFLRLRKRKVDKVSARPSFSTKYCRALAENVTKPSFYMYHEARSIFLGPKFVLNLAYFWVEYIFGVLNVLNLVHFWVFQKYTV